MNILIVDDSKLNRIMAINYITNAGLDLDIIQAESGEEAIEAVQSQGIDIILLDIVMSGMDGVGVLKWLKDHEDYKDIKVVMFTTLNEKTLLKKCFDIGASDFIQKPLEHIEFIARIKSIKRQRQLEKDTLLYIEEIKAQKHIISDVNMHMMHQEKMASVGQLAAGVAHEINNPLGFISSNFAILHDYMKKFVTCYHVMMEGEASEAMGKVRNYVNNEDFQYMIEDLDELFKETAIGVNRVTKIVKSLRNFSRVDHPDVFETYDVNEGLKDTLTIANNNIKYAAHVESDFGDISWIYCNGSQINQVFLNLLVNAVYAISEKHNNKMGTIVVKTYESDTYVIVEIGDNGKGMDQEVMRNLFNPFFTTKPVGEGTGLGLSISYDIIVNKHNGKLLVESQPGVGTTFKVYLPKEEVLV
jgi:signal transduction histidine kinase